MKKYILLCGIYFSFGLPSLAHAQSINWLPDAGAKSPYSPLSVPTKMEPAEDPLSTLLDKGYKITALNSFSSGALFILSSNKKTILCELIAPEPKTDQNIPTSRCWHLN